MAEGSMVPCIVFALFFGVAMGQYTKTTKNRNIADLVVGVNAVITNIIKIVMKVAPIGIFCLLADVAGKTGFAVIVPMAKFLGILLVGDAIQFLVFGPLTAALCKVNLFKMPKKFAKMSMMAITTTSGAICLPTKMEDEVEKFGVSRKVADFTGPITMAMNSCGAAQCYVVGYFLYGTGNRHRFEPIPDGYGNPALLSDVSWNNLRTGRFCDRLYIPCVLSWTADGQYCSSDRYRLVRRNVPVH